MNWRVVAISNSQSYRGRPRVSVLGVTSFKFKPISGCSDQHYSVTNETLLGKLNAEGKCGGRGDDAVVEATRAS